MTQHVRVKLFAVAKQVAGAEQITLELVDGARIADLQRALVEQLPALGRMAPLLRFAVNNEYAAADRAIPANAEIACIPPVSGG